MVNFEFSAQESFNSFLSSDFPQVSMLSEIALKVLLVSMSLSARTTGNSSLTNFTREGEFENKNKPFQMFSYR